LTAWFHLNEIDPAARQYLYTEIPLFYRWDKVSNRWIRRIKGAGALGRIYPVAVNDGDIFYLRLLLHHLRGCESFDDLKSWNNVVYETFYDTAVAAGIIQLDSEWELTLAEGVATMSPRQLRGLFATIILYCDTQNAFPLWVQFQDDLIQDFVYHQHQAPVLAALKHLNEILDANGKTLSDFPGFPNINDLSIHHPLDLYFLSMNLHDLRESTDTMMHSLNAEQRGLFHEITEAVLDPEISKNFFINASGGCGKSFLFNTIISFLYLQNIKSIVVSSTGISSSVLFGGRTAHSFFKIPLDIESDSFCNVPSKTRQIIIQSPVIFWDEAPALNSMIFDAVDRLCRRVMADVDQNAYERVFGGKILILAGDWKQTLPVVQFGSSVDAITSTLKFSPLWHQFHQRNLTINMRAQQDPLFADYLENVGTNHVSIRQKEDRVRIPQQLDHMVDCDSLNDLIDFVYPDLNVTDNQGMCSILTVDNIHAHQINDMVIQRLIDAGDHLQHHTYFSIDSINDDDVNANTSSHFPVEFLNSIRPSGMPPHSLQLIPNMPVMLLRNLNPSAGLCNGTVLFVEHLGERIIRARIAYGRFAGQVHLIPRIKLISSDKHFPFKLARLQFPLIPAFAMTINKSQGQTLQRVGLYLENPAFAHGQLYVGMSRVTSSHNIKIFSPQPNLKNVVHDAILNR
jgi:hypothetical protein